MLWLVPENAGVASELRLLPWSTNVPEALVPAMLAVFVIKVFLSWKVPELFIRLLPKPTPMLPATPLTPTPAPPLVPPLAAPLGDNISGAWKGTYSYASGNQPPVNFTVSFGPNGCAGRSEEPNTFGNKSAPKLFANLACSDAVLLPGHLITIKKTYDGTGGVSHSVVYTGTVSSDMRSISGRWVVNSAHGSFVMTR